MRCRSKNDSVNHNENHLKFRKLVSSFVEKEIFSFIKEWEKNWNIPKSLYKKAYEHGIYGARCPTKHGGTNYVIIGSRWDQFFNMIL